MTMDDQVDQFARVVQADEKLKAGFNAIGFSQGNTVIRGYIHKYHGQTYMTLLPFTLLWGSLVFALEAQTSMFAGGQQSHEFPF